MDYALNGLKHPITIDNSEYFNKYGKRVPRVTEVISSTIHSDALMYWSNSLGFRRIKYKDALEQSADIGNKAHSAIEHFLKENQISDNTCFLGFMKWYETVTKENNIVKLIYSEKRLVCDYFGGTLDCLIEINGKKYLIDFKTSNRVTYKYFIQISAYRYMLREVENISIDGAIVLQFNKTEADFEEYALIFDNPNHLNFINYCEECFFALLNSYYSTHFVEDEYKKIFTKGV